MFIYGRAISIVEYIQSFTDLVFKLYNILHNLNSLSGCLMSWASPHWQGFQKPWHQMFSSGTAFHIIAATIATSTGVSYSQNIADSKVHGANMGPIWSRQDPGGPHVGSMNFAIWDRHRLWNASQVPVLYSKPINSIPIKYHWRISDIYLQTESISTWGFE